MGAVHRGGASGGREAICQKCGEDEEVLGDQRRLEWYVDTLVKWKHDFHLFIQFLSCIREEYEI